MTAISARNGHGAASDIPGKIDRFSRVREHIDEKILALKAEQADREGYLGVEETKDYFAQNGVTLD